ncbi:DUF4468 domain-containing protein [Hymenobacter chitinivorans]|uniref:DUF4468 domain-containing protein n=1 Tax=Hymenobacter chitinivorans DSM 11115 TaxID=1121954 RepID=A0A2M9BRM3_9BACT|nr:DUF4468 domain-containing protein [Hymenobacter chitinivorans]PJJ60604.1 hypothetical protein CLV45_2033 [Hymenobacter chitinivorans DSM 11115]
MPRLLFSVFVVLCAHSALGQTSAGPRVAYYSPRNRLTPTFTTLADTTGQPRYLVLKAPIKAISAPAPGWLRIQRGHNTVLVAARRLVRYPDPIVLPLAAGTGQITFSTTIGADSLKLNELAARSYAWLEQQLGPVKVDSPRPDTLVMSSRTWVPMDLLNSSGRTTAFQLWYTLRLTLTNGWLRYEISRFSRAAEPSPGNPHPRLIPLEKILPPGREFNPATGPGYRQNQQRQQVQATAAELLESLQEAVQRAEGES